MLKIAISGGIGSGKSTLAAALVQHGYEVLDADSIAKSFLTDSKVKEKVVDHFPGLRNLEGLDFRSKLAQLVFADRNQLSWLESILHPLVSEKIDEVAARSDKPIFVEVPVLEAAKNYDFLVTVTAPENVRISRLRTKGMDEQDIYNRISIQPSEKEYLEAADFIFDGTTPSNEYSNAVLNLIEQITGEANA